MTEKRKQVDCALDSRALRRALPNCRRHSTTATRTAGRRCREAGWKAARSSVHTTAWPTARMAHARASLRRATFRARRACEAIPLRESGAFVWIWMGEPEEIGNHDPPVDLSHTADPDWSVALGYYDVAANWILVRENVLDLTHIAHLYRSTFRQNDWNVVPEITQKGDQWPTTSICMAAPRVMSLSRARPRHVGMFPGDRSFGSCSPSPPARIPGS